MAVMLSPPVDAAVPSCADRSARGVPQPVDADPPLPCEARLLVLPIRLWNDMLRGNDWLDRRDDIGRAAGWARDAVAGCAFPRRRARSCALALA